MGENDLHFHYVATRGEAEAIINRFDRFWVFPPKEKIKPALEKEMFDFSWD